MLRLAVIYQLVLTLLAGPLLCCCTAAQLGEAARAGSPAGADARPRKCCGHAPKSSEREHKGQQREKPGDPEKCPCKSTSSTAKASVAEVPPSASVLVGHLTADGPSLVDAAAPFYVAAATVDPAAASVDSSSLLSASRLLYVHHNLRC